MNTLLIALILTALLALTAFSYMKITAIIQAISDALDTHKARTDNPHEVTAGQAGADPAGSAQAVQDNLDTHEGLTNNPHTVTAGQVGALPVAGGALDDGADIDVGTTTGTQIGAAADRKLAFWGKTPVVQPADADQSPVAILGFTPTAISSPPTQAEVQHVQDGLENLHADVIKIRDWVSALRQAGLDVGIWKGSA